MTEPLVCAVMLTKDRPEMAKRAVECFRSQTYQQKELLVFDNGVERFEMDWRFERRIFFAHDPSLFRIGALRNKANACMTADILIHWDDDDFSHPNRIAEQVALLQASGKQAVGYRDMLFWRDPKPNSLPHGLAEWECECDDCLGAAWLYSNNDPRYCLGTSLCYWRETWERRPFPDISRGEDKAWLREVNSLGISSLGVSYESDRLNKDTMDPRMIASIHSGNHVVYEPEQSPHNWKRTSEWDSYCRERMSL